MVSSAEKLFAEVSQNVSRLYGLKINKIFISSHSDQNEIQQP